MSRNGKAVAKLQNFYVRMPQVIFDESAARRKIHLAIEATQTGTVLFHQPHTLSDEFNRGCDHVFSLLRDARLLYLASSYPAALFLSITAIEEIAKLEIAVYRSPERTSPSKRRNNDHLFSHNSKHAIALQEVITIGTRLPGAVSEARVRELLDMAESGKMTKLREAALYVETVDGQFVCPSDRIGKPLARDLLLLALEVWDDHLVGLTNHTYELDQELAGFFSEVVDS